MARTKKINVSTVSEWVAMDHMATGWYLFHADQIERETAKALCLKAVQWNSYGNAYNGRAWFPKSQAIEVTDDYYSDTKGQRAVLLPLWLIEAKAVEDRGGDVLEWPHAA